MDLKAILYVVVLGFEPQLSALVKIIPHRHNDQGKEATINYTAKYVLIIWHIPKQGTVTISARVLYWQFFSCNQCNTHMRARAHTYMRASMLTYVHTDFLNQLEMLSLHLHLYSIFLSCTFISTRNQLTHSYTTYMHFLISELYHGNMLQFLQRLPRHLEMATSQFILLFLKIYKTAQDIQVNLTNVVNTKFHCLCFSQKTSTRT